MQHILLWPTLTLLAGAFVSIPIVQNSTTRNVLYWTVLLPVAIGIVSAFWLPGIR